MGSNTVLATVFETNFGWIGLARSALGIRLSTLPKVNRADCWAEIWDEIGEVTLDDDAFGELQERFRRYFKGEPVCFHDALDLSVGTAFRRAVWQAAQSIPYGETRSYLWIAQEIGKWGAARAVGQAMGANLVPIIVPCHRVVASDGTLGGFGGGLEMKERLLRLEGASI